MLDAGEIRLIRDDLEEMLPDAATIERVALTPDGGGGSIETWNALANIVTWRGSVATPIACRIAPVRGGESGTAGGRVVEETTHMVTLPALTAVEEADRFVIGGVTYEVTLVRGRGKWELARRVEVKESPS